MIQEKRNLFGKEWKRVLQVVNNQNFFLLTQILTPEEQT